MDLRTSASSFMGWEAKARFETVGAVVRSALQLCEGCLLWARVGARKACEVAVCAKWVREQDLHPGMSGRHGEEGWMWEVVTTCCPVWKG